MFASQPWIRMPAGIEPRPPIETALLNVSDVIRRQVVAQFVPLIRRAPEFSRRRVQSQANRIPNSRGVNAHELSFRRVLENIGAMEFGRMGVRVIDVGARTNRDEHSP